MTSNSQLACWDFTLKSTDQEINILKDTLCEVCKHWCFQLEKGEKENYVHWQGRFSLRTKKRKKELIKLFKSLLLTEWDGVWFTPTSNPNTSNFNYVLKLDTRIDGPWTDKDEERFDTIQLQIFKKQKLHQWQEMIKLKCQTYNDRWIDLIYDPLGNSGKSIFAEYLEYEGLAEEIPPFRMMDDLFQWVCCRKTKPCYIVDLPRGMKKDKLADFYSGIEVIKNGVAYDKRYRAKKIRFNRPRIFVFTNTLPAFKLMSIDRWVVWTIKDNKLVDIKINSYGGIEPDL